MKLYHQNLAHSIADNIIKSVEPQDLANFVLLIKGLVTEHQMHKRDKLKSNLDTVVSTIEELRNVK